MGSKIETTSKYMIESVMRLVILRLLVLLFFLASNMKFRRLPALRI